VFWRVPQPRGRPVFGRLRLRSVRLRFESLSRVSSDGRPLDDHAVQPPREHASPLPGGPP